MPDVFDSSAAVLNAVLGDYLEQRGNGLAIQMAFYHRGRPLTLTSEGLVAAGLQMRPRVAVLVHGMAQTEACWAFQDDPTLSYGALFESELGVVSLYVRYNTGRRIAENGRALATLLERLIEASPSAIHEISLVGHSLGGLVIRSACHFGAELGHCWLERTRRAVYLGSPHLGTPLEKAGHLVSVALGVSQNPVVRLTRTLADLRSGGIKDLRHGSLTESDELLEGDPFAVTAPSALPLCAGMDHYFVAGTLTVNEQHMLTRLFGDLLVRLPSATAPGRVAGLPAAHFAVLSGVRHMDLARSPEAYAKMRAWFGQPIDGAEPSAAAESGPRLPREATRGRTLERLTAILALLGDAVLHGTTAIQEVQEELTRRPYAVIARFPSLNAPTEVVRDVHVVALRTTYGMIRLVTRLVGSGAHEIIQRIGPGNPNAASSAAPPGRAGVTDRKR